MHLEAQGLEVFTDLCGRLRRRGLRFLQLVLQSQGVPLVTAHLVERKNLDVIDDVLPLADDLADRANAV